MQIAVHDYQTTERVGALDIDEVSGAVRYLEGPAELEEWAASFADGFYSTRSHCTANCCDVGHWINLPWHREFSRQLGRQLIHMPPLLPFRVWSGVASGRPPSPSGRAGKLVADVLQ